ncbi:Protein CBG08597 [Caenorhabditis briggsae]|uniref:Uncharacterized protein n=2 Tax=Caenorhabditis briggsae TaxID=6238 RepID=A0AAE9A4G6_CAEBR|nr:Protein CBG08597 [Caenorhabditis briggsae]ULT88552.1 hypothetical protein L3Y34_007631 [Caenorhabditis briggsae]ULT88553.1 hypothetical protein L3Y34_007631 [Caenorhabditis briggsae]CAP28424.2 Protein CBG08597 [Caenorhabditis briggsae]
MFDKVVAAWRETFPKRERKLMSIGDVAAIEEFNEYFPGFADMCEENYRILKVYIRTLHPLYCIPSFRRAFAAAFALEIQLDEHLERNPAEKREGLTGEWAVHIFTDHNERTIERYRQYKRERLEKLKWELALRMKKASEISKKHENQIKWLLGREGYYEYNKSRIDQLVDEHKKTGKHLEQKKEEARAQELNDKFRQMATKPQPKPQPEGPSKIQAANTYTYSK